MNDFQEKYVNLFTDFGFKKLFGEEPNKDLAKAFETANIAKLQPEQRQAYEDSLKYYRDLKNVTDTAYDTGREEGREEGVLLGKQETALKMLSDGVDAEMIAKWVGLPLDIVQQLKSKS